jgi:serine/threonine protein kinase
VGKGILHRDIKPANLMLDHDGNVYLVDFGLVRLLDSEEETQAGIIKGTPCYMSPEQANAEVLDARSDIYSLGITLYEAATGGVGPFRADRRDETAILAEVRAGKVIPLHTMRAKVPPDLRRVVEKAIAFAPGQRYQSAVEMLTDLDSRAISQPISSGTPRLPATVVRTPAWRQWWKWTVGGAALLLALLAVLALTVFNRGPGAAPSTDSKPETSWFPWAENPLPENRRVRWLNKPIPLFRQDRMEPLWSQFLRGDRSWLAKAEPERLWVKSFDSFPTFVLLDYDAQLNWYLFDVKISQTAGAPERQHEIGIFFGYHRFPRDPSKFVPSFLLQLRENDPEAIGPNLLIGSVGVEEKVGEGKPHHRTFRRFDGASGRLELAPLAEKNGFRHIRVRAVDDRVTIEVDRNRSIELDVKKLRRDHTLRGDSELDPRGGIGIWMFKGTGYFADATVTPLPSDRPDS